MADDEDNAMSLYFSGKDAYNSGNYETAQKLFQEALVKDENIEAKAQNIKYMLGVSAFNNRDYKTAQTYLSLFEDNPIAIDLLSKIETYENTLPEDFLYYNDNSDKQIFNPATSSELLPKRNEDNGSSNQSTTIIIIATTLIIMSLSVFFEMKKNTFSRIALRLVGISSDSVITRIKDKTNPVESDQMNHLEEIEDPAQELNTASLLETPFDEEIDIEKMASMDIKEISKFFEEEDESSSNENSEELQDEQALQKDTDEKNSEEFESARNSILNSILDDEETNDLEMQEETLVNEDDSISEEKQDSEEQPDSLKTEEKAKKPKYEHLDNIPDDFNVNAAIEKAFKMIEESSRLQSQGNENQESDEFKSIEEMEKEIEEKEKINLDYFQEMEDIDDNNLNSFLDYVFEQHLEESRQ